ALTRDMYGRRINRNSPDESLILLKATGQIPHEGGRRMSKGSWQYQLFREWITAGAPWTKGSGEVKALKITPSEVALKGKGESSPLKVEATFADGSTDDITPLCDYRTNDDAVADVTNLGMVRSFRAGDTAIVVSYRGQVVPVRALVPAEAAADFVYP